MSIGLIVTELIINAVKYAFPGAAFIGACPSDVRDGEVRLEADRGG